jgi:hypothetical protein
MDTPLAPPLASGPPPRLNIKTEAQSLISVNDLVKLADAGGGGGSASSGGGSASSGGGSASSGGGSGGAAAAQQQPAESVQIHTK